MIRAFFAIVIVGLGAWPLAAQLSVTNGTSGLMLSSQGAFQVAYQNVPYNGCVSGQGGTPPYTYIVLSGSPPTGISSTFVGNCLQGTPTGTGASTFTVQVTDAKNATKTLATSITVNTLTALVVTPTGQTINTGQTLQMTTKSAGTTWSNSCQTTLACPNIDTLVTWAPVTFGTGGTIGVHTGLLTAGSAAATPSVTAAFNSTTSAGDTVTITNTSPNPVVTNVSPLPPGQINQNYPENGSTVQIIGSPACTSYANPGGGLPSGVTLNTSTGVISGTPTASGTFTPSFNCTNAGGTSANKTLNIVIATLSSIALTPATPSVLQNGTQQFTATCTYSDSPPTQNCSSQGAGGGLMFVNAGSASDFTGTTAATFDSGAINVSAGNLLLGVCRADNGLASYTASDPVGGNTWTAIGSITVASNSSSQMFYAKNSLAATADKFRCTPNTSIGFWSSALLQYSGADTVTPLDVHNETSNSSLTNACQTGSLTTTNAADFLAVFCTMNSSGRTFTPGTGYTLRSTDPAGCCGVEDQFFSSVQTAITPQLTYNGSTAANVTLSAAFKSAGGITPVVWTATDASGTNVASITNTGLATAKSPGTSNIKACIGATCSANDLMTVTAPSDTSLNVVCPANLSVGASGSCSATGVPSGAPDTNSSTWASNNTPVLTANPNGAITGVANGTATVTATLGTISGTSNTVTVSTASSGGLLTGCTVNASNTPSCSIPGGWTLVMADGAEGPPQSGEDISHASQCTAGGTTVLGTTIPAHTLNHSYCGEYAGDGQDVHVGIPVPTGSTQLYISYWDRTDPQAMYPDSDYIPMHVYSTSYALGLQAQYFQNNASTLSTTFFIHSYSPNESFWYSGPSYNPTIDAGNWTQYEMLIIPDTTNGSGSLTGNGTPPATCPTPSTTACGNGTLKFWENGVLKIDCENCNLVNTHAIFSDTAIVHIGDYLTSFGVNSGPRCTTWSSTGGGTCPGTQPGSGAPKPFFRFLDDIIVMKQ